MNYVLDRIEAIDAEWEAHKKENPDEYVGDGNMPSARLLAHDFDFVNAVVDAVGLVGHAVEMLTMDARRVMEDVTFDPAVGGWLQWAADAFCLDSGEISREGGDLEEVAKRLLGLSVA